MNLFLHSLFSRGSRKQIAVGMCLCWLTGCFSSSPPAPSPNASSTDKPPADAVASAQPKEGDSQQERPRNRLAKETSPYLLQHASNPVDWYPWGTEAFEKAKAENKLIFLSVGYSSCHWCHVMERESFMDDEIAAFLNEHFVCIKVDREERPDVDSIYMTAVNIVNGHGGWPMSVFLAPDARPFFGGTYFPARDGERGATTGFLTILQKIHELWRNEPEKVLDNCERLTKAVIAVVDGRLKGETVKLDAEFLNSVQTALADEFDRKYGGFGFSAANDRRPKFPEPSNLLFLLHRLQSGKLPEAKAEEALNMLTTTLDGMASGGIRDHIGGGFHRYSVDRYWQIPHFEKMLYDNGQLATVYAEAFALTKRPEYRRVVEELLGFVLREMTDESGGFYSAIDADAEHEEGKFYRWEKAEIQAALTPEEFDRYADRFGLKDEPNFEEKYYAPQFEAAAIRAALPDEAELHSKLLTVRNKRPRPLTDTKILTSWNGLMIAGFADAGRILENDRYLDAARKAAEFALTKLRDKQGRLLRSYGSGQAKLNAYLDDYAFLVNGLLALHRATNEPRWLEEAGALTDLQIKLFWDDKLGGFFFTSDDHESLLARGRNVTDGAEPSGQSLSVENLIRLSRELKRPELLDRAKQTIASVSALLDQSPTYAPRMAISVAETQ